ncbi:MAG TPA: hypothetical protein VHG70_17660 [Nocardioidaceae bacterium]|nr:hypothetical protein [Nocardioidaceae bacterium]
MKLARERPERREWVIGPRLLWFALLGGTAAWGVHVFFAWGLLELACLRGDLSAAALTATGLLTGLPWLLALTSLGSAVMLRARRRRLRVDVFAEERVDLLTLLAVFLNVLAVAAITGGGVALLVLEPCG